MDLQAEFRKGIASCICFSSILGWVGEGRGQGTLGGSLLVLVFFTSFKNVGASCLFYS